jgi:nitroreductase
MPNHKQVIETIKHRFSCRTYLEKPIELAQRQALEEFLAACTVGPLGASARFKLVAATGQDQSALRGLGTYGFIKNAPGFIIGAVQEASKNLEDFGYLMEQIVLFATGIELGTCWLGGTFTQSSFAEKMEILAGETMPAVVSVGYISGKPRWVDSIIHRSAGSDNRLAWEKLFFDKAFGHPLSQQAAGDYGVPLEMVRLGPSASNRQPWRIIQDNQQWHLYLQRTPGYGRSSAMFFKIADLQRVDMGIAMCHFELAARELGLKGRWVIQEPDINKPDRLTEYVVSWVEERSHPPISHTSTSASMSSCPSALATEMR